MITARYSQDKVRGILGLHIGDIPASAWSKGYNKSIEAVKCLYLSRNFRIYEGGKLDSTQKIRLIIGNQRNGLAGIFPRLNGFQTNVRSKKTSIKPPFSVKVNACIGFLDNVILFGPGTSWNIPKVQT